MSERWVLPATRDSIIDFARTWSERTEIAAARFITWIGVQRGNFYDWQIRYGMANEHTALVPRDHWLDPRERELIIAFQAKKPLEGRRRLRFKMLDADVVAASPTMLRKVLSQPGVLDRWNTRPSKKGTGFVQPLKPHEHWHRTRSGGQFVLQHSGASYYLFTVLVGCSRTVIYWDLREFMTEHQVECIRRRARELYPAASPRIIRDNGPQFIDHAFKEFIQVTGMSHVRTSPYYPHSNSSRAEEDRALPQYDHRRSDPCGPARHPGVGPPLGHPLRPALLHPPPSQCDRPCHPIRAPRRPSEGDP